jgi:hypothetical protein
MPGYLSHLIDVWCWYLMVVLTVVCPMTFMTSNRFLVARYISLPKP